MKNKLTKVLLTFLAKFIPSIKKQLVRIEQEELYKKKLEELRKRDPFVYNNH